MRGVIFAVALTATGLVAVAHAGSKPPRGGDDDDQLIAREAFRKGGVQPLRYILDATATRVPGEVVKVELEVEHGRLIYEIKVVGGDDVVRKARFDARSGAFLGAEIDD